MDQDHPVRTSRIDELSRRVFLSSVAGSLLIGCGLKAAAAQGGAGPLYVGCRIDDAERCFTTGFGADGRVVFDIGLPGRGHGAALHPTASHCVVFARRPGTFAVVIDLDRGAALYRIDAALGRHFYGHGAFSPDGRYLFTSENDFDVGRGVIGVRDALPARQSDHPLGCSNRRSDRSSQGRRRLRGGARRRARSVRDHRRARGRAESRAGAWRGDAPGPRRTDLPAPGTII